MEASRSRKEVDEAQKTAVQLKMQILELEATSAAEEKRSREAEERLRGMVEGMSSGRGRLEFMQEMEQEKRDMESRYEKVLVEHETRVQLLNDEIGKLVSC